MSQSIGGRLIFRPATTSDLSFPPRPNTATHSSTLNLPTLTYRREGNHGGGTQIRGGADRLDSSFGLSLCLHGGSSFFRSSRTRSGCRKMLKRFRRMYFRRMSFTAGGTGSRLPEESDGGGSGGGGGGDDDGRKGEDGGGGDFDGGDLRLETFPLWWWWRSQSGSESGDGEKKGFEYIIPIEFAWRPEKESESEQSWEKGEDQQKQREGFLGKVKRFWRDNSEAILEAILWPFVWLTLVVSEPAFRRISRECFRPFIPFPIAFVQYIHMTVEYALAVTFLLFMGTSLLLMTLLVWWAWRRRRNRGSDSDHNDDGGDGDEF